MTSLERIDALLAGRPVDRVPHFPFLLGFCARNMGYPISIIYSDAEKSFDNHVKGRTFNKEAYRFIDRHRKDVAHQA